MKPVVIAPIEPCKTIFRVKNPKKRNQDLLADILAVHIMPHYHHNGDEPDLPETEHEITYSALTRLMR
jgi:hypothetical protein